jgi:hypothetical protein
MFKLSTLTGWGPNDRAWWDDEFWMDATLAGVSALVAGLFGYLLYRAGVRKERREQEKQYREQLAREILEALLDMRPPVNDQMNSATPDLGAIEAISELSRRVMRLGDLAGRGLGTLPAQIGREIWRWTRFAAYAVPGSPNRPPDLIEYAYELDRYIDQARGAVAHWRDGESYELTDEPTWVAARKRLSAEHYAERERRRGSVRGGESPREE